MSDTYKAATPCPCCGSEYRRPYAVNGREHMTLATCDACGGLLGSCYRGDSPVLLVFDDFDDSARVDQRYFDLDLLGSDGVKRVHGWYNPQTMKVTQFG